MPNVYTQAFHSPVLALALTLALALALLTPLQSNASDTLYIWTADDGSVVFADRPPAPTAMRRQAGSARNATDNEARSNQVVPGGGRNSDTDRPCYVD